MGQAAEKQQEQAGESPDVVAQIDGIQAMIDGDYQPEAETGQGNGRPEAANQPEMDSGEMCTGLLQVISPVIASRRGPHWLLEDEESQAVGTALGKVLDKYMPEIKAGPEGALVVTSLMVFGPRLMMDVQIQKQQEQQEQQKREEGNRHGDTTGSESTE